MAIFQFFPGKGEEARCDFAISLSFCVKIEKRFQFEIAKLNLRCAATNVCIPLSSIADRLVSVVCSARKY